jgi:hypothetical protein
MPIFHDGRVLASLNVSYLTRAVKLEEAVERYAGPLRDAVNKIMSALDQPQLFTKKEINAAAGKTAGMDIS